MTCRSSLSRRAGDGLSPSIPPSPGFWTEEESSTVTVKGVEAPSKYGRDGSERRLLRYMGVERAGTRFCQQVQRPDSECLHQAQGGARRAWMCMATHGWGLEREGGHVIACSGEMRA